MIEKCCPSKTCQLRDGSYSFACAGITQSIPKKRKTNIKEKIKNILIFLLLSNLIKV